MPSTPISTLTGLLTVAPSSRLAKKTFFSALAVSLPGVAVSEGVSVAAGLVAWVGVEAGVGVVVGGLHPIKSKGSRRVKKYFMVRRSTQVL